MTSNFATPSGRTSVFAMSRPSDQYPWRMPRPVVERIHGFWKILEAAPKHHFTKGAGDREYMGRANGALTADVEGHGDFGMSGMRSLLAAFFSSMFAPDEVEANVAWRDTFNIPLSPTVLFTLCEYDGVARVTEVPSVMLTSLELAAKHDSLFTWMVKGMGDQVLRDEAALNTAEDILAAAYYSDRYKDKYSAHDASVDSTVNGSRFGRTWMKRVPVPSDLEGSDFSADDEVPWNDFKMMIDLKAIAVNSQRRSKNMPAINDLPELKIDMSIPTESRNVDTQGVWAALIDASFEEGGNRTTPQFPFEWKMFMELCGPLIGDSADNPFFTQLKSPRLAARCTNPVAASSGLEPLKAEFIGMRALGSTIGIPGPSPIYFIYQSDVLPSAPLDQFDAPVVDPVEVDDVQVTGTSSEDGAVVNVYADGVLVGTSVVNSGTWAVSTAPLPAGAEVKARVGLGEEASDFSAVIYVTYTQPVISPTDNLDANATVTATAYDDGATVNLYRGGSTLVGSAIISGGTASVAGPFITGWSLTAVIGAGTTLGPTSAAVVVS